MNEMLFRQGEIYYFKLDPTIGNEMKKTRPCMIISNNRFNRHYNTRWVIPISSQKKYYRQKRYQLSPFFMIVTNKNRITLNMTDRKILGIKAGDHLTVDPRTHALVKIPTKKQWARLLKDVPKIKID